MCFGSNEAGIHGAGAAYVALKNHGARSGVGFGHVGNSFAIPTKDFRIRTLNVDKIKSYVDQFIWYAQQKPEYQFQVTCIGSGLAGHRDADMASLFKLAPNNCFFDTKWKIHLGDGKQYWGTY